MQTVEVIRKHDDQILSIKDSLSDITTKITVMINNYNHLSNKVEEILDTSKCFDTISFKINNIEKDLIELNEKVNKLEELATEEKNKVNELERKSHKFKDLLKALNNHWGMIISLMTILGIVVGYVIDYFYKLPPPK
ncbi:MAG: hypothetical protein ACFFD1_00035 [Candidatus Thorarchaeota archaeon]